MNDNEIFERFPDFIREYIYSHSWDSLRAVQTAAAKSIFGTENNLLLTSSTASGKTEAAFFRYCRSCGRICPARSACFISRR